jgi:putative membrane protein
MQSVSLHQGPLLRMLRLADVHVHTVAGPIRATLDGLDAAVAAGFFRDVAATAIAAAQRESVAHVVHNARWQGMSGPHE